MNEIKTYNKKRAIIYCRVSTKEQVEEGNSLATQERICKEYALKNEYDIVELFIEQGESAKTADRTELKKLLSFCADKKNGIKAVIIYKLDRLSRNTDDYSQLRLLFKRYGVEIKSTSEYFDNNPIGRFMENTMANIAQFDNDIRAERSVGGMKQAMREGRFVWMAPVGYNNVRVNGKVNIAQNHQASLIKETFEMIAQKTYATEDVRKLMTKKGLVHKSGKPFCRKYFYKILENKLYTGLIEVFGESHKGTFDPIISEATFNEVQRILKNRGKKMAQYKKDNKDFPLRRFIFSENKLKLTGYWAQGRSKKYPYYRFIVKGSNYQKEEFEKQFMKHMDKYSLNPQHIKKLKAALAVKLNKATKDERKSIGEMQQLIQELTEKQSALVQKNLDGVLSDSLFKQEIERIENKLYEIQVVLANAQAEEKDYDELINFAQEYLEKPSNVWKEASLQKRVKLQWFEFPSGLIFDGEIFRTTQLANVFSAKTAISTQNRTQVHFSSTFLNQLKRELEYLYYILKDDSE